MRRKRRNAYKFGDKKHSGRGKASLVLAALSLAAGIVLAAVSVQKAGEADVYVGSAGVFALFLAAFSLALGLSSLGEDSYKLFPVLGSICSGVVLAGWAAIYVMGFLGV